ncbi:glucosamine--fructose-6-phosphate aminotransferase [Alkalihalobacillus alcalophilus ATCC 27647 = CGMCC 1.3604]|nr:glucosamine--fructose-6-phosphate aminotransferase [Alkalihalobacillus alcalophilus ATCC 27647 = CGMCC 1.3604]
MKDTYEIINKQKFKKESVDMHYFIGCGTSFYLAISAAKYFQSVTGQFASAVPASEIFLNPDVYFTENKTYKVVVISRSGTTSEAVAALKFINKKTNTSSFAVTCFEESPLAELADEVIALEHINEKSVVMTQSFTNMLYALQLYTTKLMDAKEDWTELKEIPRLVGDLLLMQDSVKRFAAELTYRRFIYLGASYYNGLAKEVTLKLKEMTQTECESYSNLEFRHGPISIVDDRTVVVVMSQKQTEDLDQDLVKDIQRLGGKVLALGPYSETFEADYTLTIGQEISDRNRLVLYVPLLQYLAYYRALRLGYDPDKPKNLSQVVELNL